MAVQGSMEVQGRFERFMGGSGGSSGSWAVRGRFGQKKYFFLTIFFFKKKKKKPNLNRPNRTGTGPEPPGTGTAT